MDGLSAASSAFAVVSLAIQIGGGIRELYNFWGSIQDGPNEIRRIINDLNIISNVLEDIRQEASREKTHSRVLNTSLAALDGCSETMEALQNMVEELQSGSSAQKRTVRRWAAFKAAWKGDRIRKYQETLREMKITLILARQNAIEYGTLSISLSSNQFFLMPVVTPLRSEMSHSSRSWQSSLRG